MPSPTFTPSPVPTKPIHNVTVKVTDADGSFVDRAAVLIYFPDSQNGQTGWTDASGSVVFSDIEGFSFSISIQAMGFLSYKSLFDISPDTSLVQATLERDPVSVENCDQDSVYSNARAMKMDLYKSINYQPDIMVFGSSRAYTISPQYIQQLTGYKTFNMAVNFGSILDAYYYSKYVFAHQENHPPKLLIVEAQLNTINQASVDSLTPIELWPLLAGEETFKPQIDLCDHVFSPDINQTYLDRVTSSDALLWTFQPDGLAVHRPLNYKQYRIAADRMISGLGERMRCDELSSMGLEYIEKFVEFADQNNARVMIFRSPIHGDIYAGLRDDPLYQNCSNLLNDFMTGLMAKYGNLYFQDLSGYEPIISLDFEGFYDGQHFTPKASGQIVDLLLPDIKSALAP
jgi:hypothetical protein